MLVRDIDFSSTSEETLLPFHGRCHIAYVPSAGVVLGLSKLARLTKLAARRVQTQEALTQRVLRALCGALRPQGIAVVVDARHLTYTAPSPPQLLTAAATGCMAPGGSECGGALLDEALAMLGLDAEALAAEGRPLQLLAPGQLPCTAGGAQQQAAQQPQPCGGPGMRRAASASGSDSPMAPVTPDPSDRDDEASSAGYPEGASDGDGAASLACSSCGDGDAAAGGMEAAVAALLSAAGVPNVGAPALQAGVRRYVMALLAATSGYHQELPLAVAARRGAPHACNSCCGAVGSSGHSSGGHSSGNSSSSSAAGALTQAAAAAGVPWHEHHVQFVSQCEHHMLPFYGSVHIAYTPAGSCCAHGCSGAASGSGSQQQQHHNHSHGAVSHEEVEQVVAAFTQRLQVQERITQQVADAVAAMTGARGVIVAVRAAHMCMVARGVENHAGTTLTRAASGEFEARPDLRTRFLRAVAARGEPGAGASATACGCGC